jgi:hypothetical protein
MELISLAPSHRNLLWAMLDDNHNVIMTEDVHQWGPWYEDYHNRRVKRDESIKHGWELCTDFIHTLVSKDLPIPWNQPFESMLFLLDTEGKRIEGSGISKGEWLTIRRQAREYRNDFFNGGF